MKAGGCGGSQRKLESCDDSRRKPEVVPPAELKDQNPVRVGS